MQNARPDAILPRPDAILLYPPQGVLLGADGVIDFFDLRSYLFEEYPASIGHGDASVSIRCSGLPTEVGQSISLRSPLR
jgi:hypothetical protein